MRTMASLLPEKRLDIRYTLITLSAYTREFVVFILHLGARLAESKVDC